MDAILKNSLLSEGKLFTVTRSSPVGHFLDNDTSILPTVSNTAQTTHRTSQKCFYTSAEANAQLSIPRTQKNFNLSYHKRNHNLRYAMLTDTNLTISLAMYNKFSPTLNAYTNKLPIMVINTARLLYTVDAFKFRNNLKQTSVSVQALEFYVNTDLKYRSIREPPNMQFSQMLHRLRSNGYGGYIFDLARELNLNVDVVYSKDVVARYTNIGECYFQDNGHFKMQAPAATCLESFNIKTAIIEPENTECLWLPPNNTPTTIFNNNRQHLNQFQNLPNSSAIGFITVIRNADKWYVNVTKDPISTISEFNN